MFSLDILALFLYYKYQSEVINTTDTDNIFKFFGDLFDSALEDLDRSDYVLDEVQANKLIRAYNFFERLVKEQDGSIETEPIDPRLGVGGITAYFNLLYLSGDELIEFSEVLKDISALSMNANLYGVCNISFNIPGVFKKRS